MNTRNVNVKCRIIIVELKIESHATGSIQKIVQNRHGINVYSVTYKNLLKCITLKACMRTESEAVDQQNYRSFHARNSSHMPEKQNQVTKKNQQ